MSKKAGKIGRFDCMPKRTQGIKNFILRGVISVFHRSIPRHVHKILLFYNISILLFKL